MLYHVRILLVEEKVPRQPSFPRAEIGLLPHSGKMIEASGQAVSTYSITYPERRK